jgi:hypothetical protein
MMYVNPFFFGVGLTLFTEMLVIVAVGLYSTWRNKKDGE